MRPVKQTINQLSDNPDYDFQTAQSQDCWPGYMTVYVYRDRRDGTYGGAYVHMTDDSGDGEDAKEWFEMLRRETVTYERKS